MATATHVKDAALAALRERPHRFGELRARLGVTDSQTFNTLARLRKQGLVERTEVGLYSATGNGDK